MTEIELPRVPPEISAEALFRHRVVAAVLALELLGHKRAQAVLLTVECHHLTAVGGVRIVSARTLYRWLAAYTTAGIAALEPAARQLKTTALSESLVQFLQSEKHDDPEASIPEILRRARQREIVTATERVHRATAWRVASRLGLPLTRSKAKAHTDMRRFAHGHRMRMVLVDGKHFRAGAARLKRMVFFFIDDCTRRVIGLVVGSSENSPLLLRGLFEVIRHFGKMDVLYLDRGPGFIADDTHAVCVRLDVCFIHGRARYPEAHGKVEAFNKTAKHDVLRGLARSDVDPGYGSLELRLRHYVENQYNVRPHESLGGRTPSQRWDTDDRELVFPRDHVDLRSRFVLTESRRVSADNIVSVDGTYYEVPVGHAGQSIPVERHLLTHKVWIVHQGTLVQLHPVDLVHNAEDRRGRPETAPQPEREAPVTAAAMAFAKDFGPAPGVDSEHSSSHARKPRKDRP